MKWKNFFFILEHVKLRMLWAMRHIIEYIYYCTIQDSCVRRTDGMYTAITSNSTWNNSNYRHLFTVSNNMRRCCYSVVWWNLVLILKFLIATICLSCHMCHCHCCCCCCCVDVFSRWISTAVCVHETLLWIASLCLFLLVFLFTRFTYASCH